MDQSQHKIATQNRNTKSHVETDRHLLLGCLKCKLLTADFNRNSRRRSSSSQLRICQLGLNTKSSKMRERPVAVTLTSRSAAPSTLFCHILCYLSLLYLSILSIYLLSNLYICILLHHLTTLCLPIPKFLYQSHSTPSIYLLSVYIYLRLYTNLLLSLLYLCCIQPITMYVHKTLLYIIYLHYFTYTSVFVPI